MISGTTVALAALVACKSAAVDSVPILAAGRRLNGDVVLLSMAGSFTDVDQVRLSIQQDHVVEHAIVFTTLPVRAVATAAAASAVLKFEPLDDSNAQGLGLTRSEIAAMQSPAADLPIAIGSLLSHELRIQSGDRLTIELPAQAEPKAHVLCLIAAVVHLGIEHFDRQLIVADASRSSVFTSDPTGIEIRLFQPATRVSFASQLEEHLGRRFRAIPLEELVAPLLSPKHADRP